MNYVLTHVGADPELFLATQKGKMIPAIGLIGGTKDEPLPISELGPGHCKQEDNVMVEFNIPPAATKEAFVSSLTNVLAHLEQQVKQKDLKLVISSSHVFDKVQLSHPQAMTMGCDPDFCVWTRSINETVSAAQAGRLRTAGGHIHLGFTVDGEPPEVVSSEPIVKMCDLVFGLPSLFVDSDNRRRSLYGRAGAFRLKNYGIEYRTLSNWWIRSPEYQGWVFDQAHNLFSLFNGNPKHWSGVFVKHSKSISETINRADSSAALQLLKIFGLYDIVLKPLMEIKNK